MKIETLKGRIARTQEHLEKKAGQVVVYGKTGPVGLGLIEDILEILEDQEARIRELETGREGK